MTDLFAVSFDYTDKRIETCHCEDPREGGRGDPFSPVRPFLIVNIHKRAASALCNTENRAMPC